MVIRGLPEYDDTEEKYLADQLFKDIGCSHAEIATRLAKK